MAEYEELVDEDDEEEIVKLNDDVLNTDSSILVASKEDDSEENNAESDEKSVRGKKVLKNRTIFGQQLRKLRLSKGMTQTQVAELLGLKTNTLSKIESGIYAYLNMDAIMELSDIFNVSIDFLVRGKNFENQSGGNSFIQSNVQTDNGSIVVNGKERTLSSEESELLRTYEALTSDRKFDLISHAFTLKRDQETVARRQRRIESGRS